MVQGKKNGRKTKAMQAKTTFGPVSAISTAPVSFGNSIRGSRPAVEQIPDGCRVRGRDFAFEVGSTVAAATGWTLIGGIPLTPCAMPATSLKSYCQMFARFKVNSLSAHFITSSPTSQAGDVMFYYEKDRTGPMIDCSSTSFLPYVLSDANTVLGPQWTNHTAILRPDPEFKSTDYGMNADLNEEASGSLFIFSKTNSANSPGYVIFDYDITFKEHQANPRAGLLPVTRAQWTPTCFGQTTVAQTAGTSLMNPVVQGKTIAGINATNPTGFQAGDIYKVVFDVTNSTISGTNTSWTGPTSATLLQAQIAGGALVAQTVDDGFTCYMVRGGASYFMYPTLQAAMTGTLPYLAGATGTNTYNICAYVSLVGFTSNVNLQNTY